MYRNLNHIGGGGGGGGGGFRVCSRQSRIFVVLSTSYTTGTHSRHCLEKMYM